MFEIRLENESGSVVDINDGKNYLVVGISGINPPSAMVYTSKSPNRKGVKKNGSSLAERYITVSIKLLGDIEANRNNLYAWTDSEQYCKIYYRNDAKNVYCEGTVQDNTFDIFTDNEIVEVAFICEDPYWKALAEISTDVSLLLSQFVIPFAIESAGVPFSTMRDTTLTNIFNAGTETGVQIHIRVLEDTTNLVIRDGADATKTFTINTTLKAGMNVVIDTDHSPKTCKGFNEDGSVVNLMPYVGNKPHWFTLKKGNNLISYAADTGLNGVEMKVAFTVKHLGV